MRSAHLVAGAIHLCVVFLFWGVSFFLMAAFWAPLFREHLAQILIDKPVSFLIFGLVLFVIGTILFSFYYLCYRGQYLKIAVKPFACKVDAQVIAKYIQNLLEKKELGTEIKVSVSICFFKKVDVILYVAKDFFVKNDFGLDFEKEISEILLQQFNYKKSFTLTLAYL